jgi:hypothetical protein
MPAGFNDDECKQQFRLTIDCQHVLQFSVHCHLGRGHHAQIKHAGALCLYKHQVSEVAVTSDKHSVIRLSRGKKLTVNRPRKPEVRGGDDVMSQLAQESNGYRIDILVREKPHLFAVR